MSRNVKIAYLTLVHRNPRLLERAIRVLSTSNSAFFVHVDKKSDIRLFAGLSGESAFFIERIPAFWGEFSLVEATLRLMKYALASEAKYDYFVLLLGSDYPLRSGSYVERFLEQEHGCEFMNAVKLPSPGFPMSKINKIRYPSDRPALRFASRALARVGLAYRDHRKHLGGIIPFAGDQSWTLSRAACEYILAFTEAHPGFRAYFQNTFTSDEMFFHTILGNSPFYSEMRRNLLYRYWPTPSAHPELLTDRHLASFEKQERVWLEDEFGAGEAIFARKFTDDNLELIDRVDAMIESKERCASGNGGVS